MYVQSFFRAELNTYHFMHITVLRKKETFSIKGMKINNTTIRYGTVPYLSSQLRCRI